MVGKDRHRRSSGSREKGLEDFSHYLYCRDRDSRAEASRLKLEMGEIVSYPSSAGMAVKDSSKDSWIKSSCRRQHSSG